MTTIRKFPTTGVTCTALAVLSACGGGGSGNSSSSVTTYQVSATAGTGGSISPSSAMVTVGGTTMLTVTANSGYAVGSVTGCGGTLSGSTYTTGTINAVCSVTASFIAQYAVTATAGTGGMISPPSTTVNAGGTAMLTVTANSGYAVGSVTGCGGTLSGSTYTTGTINAACSVTASFIAQYAVTATAGTGGMISPASVTVNAGSKTTLTVTPGTGYVVSAVTGCGGSLAGTTYTTGTINAACAVTASFAAAFTWVSGSNTPDAPGVYGTQGVAAAPNVPGARDASKATWRDASGNLWMLGGFSGYAGALDSTVGNFSNDLWKYSPSSGEWTWVSGSNTTCSPGIYGTQGVPAATNVPGARTPGITWTDANGNLWLFGGGGCDSTGAFVLYDDLWEYAPSSGEWTWVGGPMTAYADAVYGTQGVPADTNTPGGRTPAALWTDANGNVWMFGGFGTYLSSGNHVGARLNDLWEYLAASHKWVWIGGPNGFNQPGVYGTRGMPQVGTVPGARDGAVSWTDAQGNFWLFGGYGYDIAGALLGELNDLWEYSPSSGEWTWVGGSNVVNPAGNYGTQGTAAAANVPGGRDAAASWTDTSGNLWLFGGEGYDPATHSFHRFNDLWKLASSNGQWTWVAGSNTFDVAGVYGTQGVAAATNMPGARASIFTWMDTSGNAWLFGGYQFDGSGRHEMNDLWVYPTQ